MARSGGPLAGSISPLAGSGGLQWVLAGRRPCAGAMVAAGAFEGAAVAAAAGVGCCGEGSCAEAPNRPSHHRICCLRPSPCDERRGAAMSGRGRGGGLAATPSEAAAAGRGCAAAGAAAGKLTEPTSRWRASCGCCPSGLGSAARPSSAAHVVEEEVGGCGLGPTGGVVRPLGAAAVVQGWPPLVRRFRQRVQRSGRSAA